MGDYHLLVDNNGAVIGGPVVSGRNPAFDQDGRLRLTPELERVIEERVRAGIAQFACDLLAACQDGHGITTQRLRRALQPYANCGFICAGCGGPMTVDTQNICHCPNGCEFGVDPAKPGSDRTVILFHGDRYEETRGPQPLTMLQGVVEGMRRGLSAAYCATCGTPYLPHSQSHGFCNCCRGVAFCNTCNGTGFDFYTHCPCPDCAQPNSPAPQQAQDAVGCPACNGSTSDPHAGYPGCFSGAAPAPNPPTSRCCGADVFEECGRTICQNCRVGCKLR